ncbi:MAG: peptide-methionine (S)-S-oxide reductase MsrA [Pseudomonadota bacterium]
MLNILNLPRTLILAAFTAAVFAASPLMADEAVVAKISSIATFAGGCFWSIQRHFDAAEGVVSTRVGYTGGTEVAPTYENVSSEKTGHTEAIEVTFDPAKTTYKKLLTSYWHYIDPTTKDGQFCDFGPSYRTAIYTHDAAQKADAEASKAEIEKSGVLKGPIVTEITDAGPFWPAEDYHQAFYKKNPVRYETYRIGCGRDAMLKRIWGDAAE